MRGGIPSFCNERSVLHPGFGLGIVGAAGEPDAAEDHRHAGDVEQVQPLAEEGNREQARKRRHQVHEHLGLVRVETRETAFFQNMYRTVVCAEQIDQTTRLE